MSYLSRRVFLSTTLAFGAMTTFSASLAGDNVSPAPGMRVALRGYDPVSYFTTGRPEKGSAAFSTAFDDAVYWFKNPEHLAMFVADPDRYAPQYGGFCAITVARGGVAEPDPEAWTISDGKLYVFRSKEGVSIFQQQANNIVEQATANWLGLYKRP